MGCRCYVAAILLFFVAVSQGDVSVNINFSNMLSGFTTSSPPSPSTTGNALMTLSYAVDAAHVRVAEKGLWTKIWVIDNDQWLGMGYDTGCEPSGAKFPFPSKTGAFGELLNRGLRVAYPSGRLSFSDGSTNPPTGITINYMNAIFAEMRANYGQLNITWVPYSNRTEYTQKLKARAFDLGVPVLITGYILSDNYDPSNRYSSYVTSGCNSYIYPTYVVGASSAPYRNLDDLIRAGANLKVGVYGSSTLPFLPNATIINIPGDVDFTTILRMATNRTLDIFWDATVLASDIAGTELTLNQFVNIPIGEGYVSAIPFLKDN